MKERSSTVRQGVTVRHNPCQGNRHDPNLRFEEQVDIRITCCGTAMSLLGNLSLREAGGTLDSARLPVSDLLQAGDGDRLCRIPEPGDTG